MSTRILTSSLTEQISAARPAGFRSVVCHGGRPAHRSISNCGRWPRPVPIAPQAPASPPSPAGTIRVRTSISRAPPTSGRSTSTFFPSSIFRSTGREPVSGWRCGLSTLRCGNRSKGTGGSLSIPVRSQPIWPLISSSFPVPAVSSRSPRTSMCARTAAGSAIGRCVTSPPADRS